MKDNVAKLVSDVLNAFHFNELSIEDIIILRGYLDLFLFKRLVALDKDFVETSSDHLYELESGKKKQRKA